MAEHLPLEFMNLTLVHPVVDEDMHINLFNSMCSLIPIYHSKHLNYILTMHAAHEIIIYSIILYWINVS